MVCRDDDGADTDLSCQSSQVSQASPLYCWKVPPERSQIPGEGKLSYYYWKLVHYSRKNKSFKMGITDLEEQFTFYASYHHNGLNKLIHILCVWPILWTALVFLQYLPIEVPISVPFHPANVAFIASVFYAGVYVLMDKKAGSLGALLVFICLITSRRFYLGTEGAWQTAVVIHVVCWIAQFVGHGAFEGRAPALLDNVMQAFVMAPLFVLLEVLFPLGYRKDMQDKLWKNVENELAKLKQQKKSKAIKK